MSNIEAIPVVDAGFDLAEMVVLATVSASGGGHRSDPLRRVPLAVVGSDRARIDETCRRLLARCALTAAPRSPCGYDVSLIGLARLHRFLRSPIGSACGGGVDAECTVRRMVLDTLPPEEREEIVRRLCDQLVERRAGVFRCIHADLCAGKGCPFAADVELEAIDRGMVALTGTAPVHLQ